MYIYYLHIYYIYLCIHIVAMIIQLPRYIIPIGLQVPIPIIIIIPNYT